MSGPYPDDRGRAWRWLRDVTPEWLKRARRRVLALPRAFERKPGRLVQRHLRRLPDELTFVQVGANDGVTGDPLHDQVLAREGWRGVLIEPVPFCFEQLRSTYGQLDRLTLLNVAIGDPPGTRTLYYLAEEAADHLDLPKEYDQLGSFDRDHISAHFGPDVEPFVVEASVECIPLTEAVRRAGLTTVDLLHIDTEGYDFEVLKMIDFETMDPGLIIYEHKHLDPDDRKAAERLLTRHGLRCRRDVYDTVAVRRGGRS